MEPSSALGPLQGAQAASAALALAFDVILAASGRDPPEVQRALCAGRADGAPLAGCRHNGGAASGANLEADTQSTDSCRQRSGSQPGGSLGRVCRQLNAVCWETRIALWGALPARYWRDEASGPHWDTRRIGEAFRGTRQAGRPAAAASTGTTLPQPEQPQPPPQPQLQLPQQPFMQTQPHMQAQLQLTPLPQLLDWPLQAPPQPAAHLPPLPAAPSVGCAPHTQTAHHQQQVAAALASIRHVHLRTTPAGARPPSPNGSKTDTAADALALAWRLEQGTQHFLRHTAPSLTQSSQLTLLEDPQGVAAAAAEDPTLCLWRRPAADLWARCTVLHLSADWDRTAQLLRSLHAFFPALREARLTFRMASSAAATLCPHPPATLQVLRLHQAGNADPGVLDVDLSRAPSLGTLHVTAVEDLRFQLADAQHLPRRHLSLSPGDPRRHRRAPPAAPLLHTLLGFCHLGEVDDVCRKLPSLAHVQVMYEGQSGRHDGVRSYVSAWASGLPTLQHLHLKCAKHEEVDAVALLAWAAENFGHRGVQLSITSTDL